ncbi:MAG: KAP family NTPase [Reichenbachiella sp.]
MIKIEHTQTGKTETVSRLDWEKKGSKYNKTRELWKIIEEGDPVVLCELLGVEDTKELYITDRDHALKMINSNTEKYFLKELEDSKLKPVVPLNLKRSQYKKTDTEEFVKKVAPKLKKVVNDNVSDSEPMSPMAKLSDEILLYLLEKRRKDSSIKFWLRNKNRRQDLGNGLWFTGNDSFVHIAITSENDNLNRTKTLAFVIKINKEGNINEVYSEVTYRSVEDEEKLACYRDIVLSFTNKENASKKHFFYYDEKDWRKAIDNYFDDDRIVITNLISQHDLTSEFEISDAAFQSMLDDTLESRKELGYPDIISVLDKSSVLWSDSAADADELGRDSLVRGVTKSINKLFESYKKSYTVLLNGEWGSGKSSMLNFFEEHLENSGWHVVKYNAWENQKFNDPWWILINKISESATKNSLKGSFPSHSYWKFKLQYRHKIWAFALLIIFGVSTYFLVMSGQVNNGGIKISLPLITSILGLVGAVTTGIIAITNNFFFKSISQDELKERFTEHPFDPIRKRFNDIAADNQLAIFIDDLDRCDVDATVSLLEGIQNLFKETKVLYIIAADGQWVSNCFTQKYSAFKAITNDGCSVGDKFLQKSFQMTLNVPKPKEDFLKQYWDKLIGHKDQDSSSESNDEEATAPIQESTDTLKRKVDKAIDEQKEEFEENIEKYLRKFLDMGVPNNPRQMKRFVNQFEVASQTLLIEGKLSKYVKEEDSSLVKFLIFSMSFPSIADKLKKGETTKENIITVTNDVKDNFNLTDDDRNTIKDLLNGIDNDLIKGDFYSV